MTPWQALHDGFVRCASSRARTVLAFCPSTISTSASTFGGGDAGGVPSTFSSSHCAAQHGRSAIRIRRHEQHAAFAEQAEAVRVVELDAAEARAAHVVHAVVARERLVDERVIGRQEIEHAALGAEDAVDEQRRLRDEVVANVAVDVGEHRTDRAPGSRARRRAEPLEREVRRERLGARIGEHALDLAAAARRDRASRSAAASSSSSASGIELHKKKESRDASSTLDSGIRAPGAAPRACGSKRYRNFGMREHARERVLDALLEAAARGALVVEPHQPRQVVVVERAAERLARERRDDLFGARLLARAARLRPADEDLSRGSACSLKPRDVHGTEDSSEASASSRCPGRRPALASRAAGRTPRTSGAGT